MSIKQMQSMNAGIEASVAQASLTRANAMNVWDNIDLFRKNLEAQIRNTNADAVMKAKLGGIAAKDLERYTRQGVKPGENLNLPATAEYAQKSGENAKAYMQKRSIEILKNWFPGHPGVQGF